MKSFLLFTALIIQTFSSSFASPENEGTILRTIINGNEFSYKVNHNGRYGSGQIHPNFEYISGKLFILDYLNDEPNAATKDQIITEAEENCEVLALSEFEEYQDDRYTYELHYFLESERGYFYSEPSTVAGLLCRVEVIWKKK